ncbi:MAG TPA: hypothetical protein VKQ36_06545, partial [Ktedonobacterales bacterium]|nr:hypothetical protein [Ktedonobacterales bacterium]
MSERIESLQESAILPHAAEDTEDEEASGEEGESEQPAIRRPHVALIGRTGSGKTAIARAIFGADTEPTLVDIADRYQREDAPVLLDDLPGWTHGNESSLDSLFS